MTSVPFALPDIGDAEIEAVTRVLRSKWITTGEETLQFEREFAEFVGARHAIAVNSCTAALHLSLEAVGVGPGDEVILPTYTFAATAEVVLYLGATPVLVDIEPTHNQISLAAVQAAITQKTKAIIPVHFAGRACDLDSFTGLCEENSLFLIEDAAHAFPTTYRGSLVGSHGDLTCFSFYATKTLTTGEGGMVTTSNDEWADRIRIMRLHGISKDAWKRYMPGSPAWYYEIVAPGFKYNLTDIASAIGRVQLARTAEMHGKRVKIARQYERAFSDIGGLDLPSIANPGRQSWHLYVIKLRSGQVSRTRDELVRLLSQQGVGTSVHFIPLHLHPFYSECFGYAPGAFPTSESEYSRSISLPISSSLTTEEVDYVASTTRGLLE